MHYTRQRRPIMSITRNRSNHFFIVVILLLAALPVLAGDKVEVGSKAPEFKLPVALSDSTISLSDFVDKKVVIVHFWKSR